MNLGQLKLRVRRTFGDESSVQVSDTDLLDWTNDGQKEVVRINPELMEAIGLASTVGGQMDYPLPVDTKQIRSIEYKGLDMRAYQPLNGLSLQEMDKYASGFDGDMYGQSDPRAYCTFAGVIKLFPTPAVSAPDGLKIYYYRMPHDLAIDSDDIDLPASYHSSVVDYVLKRAYELDEDWTSVANKSSEFSAGVNMERTREKYNNTEYYSRISVRPEDEDWF